MANLRFRLTESINDDTITIPIRVFRNGFGNIAACGNDMRYNMFFFKKSVPMGHAWISQIFTSKAAVNGGIVRRSIASVVEYASIDMLRKEVIRRGYHMVESGDQFVIFCHFGEMKIVA